MQARVKSRATVPPGSAACVIRRAVRAVQARERRAMGFSAAERLAAARIRESVRSFKLDEGEREAQFRSNLLLLFFYRCRGYM